MKFLLIVLVMVSASLQYRLWVGDGSLAHLVRLNHHIGQQTLENDSLRTRNQLLAAEVDALKDGTEGIEERARLQMGMIKEGETFYMIVEEAY